MTTSTGPGWTLVRRPPPVMPTPSGEQAAAARPALGVTVVLGGPGTGKTTALVEAVTARVACGASLDRVVVLAPSRPEAQELRRQLALRLGRAQVAPRVTTLHGFVLALLRELGHTDDDFRLLRAPEQELRIRELLDGLDARFWPAGVRPAVGTRTFARQLRDVLARARQLSLDPSLIHELAEHEGDELFQAVARFFDEYLTVSDWDASLDYAELVHRGRLLLADEQVARTVRARFDAVVIDDVHEFDAAQIALTADLAALGLPVHAFADPQQRIGGFRGATATAVPTLARLPGARTVALTQGFRTGLAVSQALAALRQRLSPLSAPPTPAPVRAVRGRVSASIYDDDVAEVAHVAQALRESVLADGLEWADLAVVVRAGRTQLAPLARELTRFGIPVDVAGDELALGSQQAVQVLLLALAVAARGGAPDPEEAHRLFTSPLAGLDAVQLRHLGRALLQRHRVEGNSVQLLGRCLGHPDLLAGIDSEEARTARRLADLLRGAGTLLDQGAGVQAALWQLWEGTSWPQQLRQASLAGSRRANHDLDAVVELFEQASRRDDLMGRAGARTFITEVEGQEIPADTGREVDLVGRGVRVLTAHRARSGQWRRVWVLGVREGMWPQLSRRTRLLDPDRLAPGHLDAVSATVVLGDERRLMYTACARASEELHVSAAQGTEGEAGRASRFLAELGVPVERVYGLPLRKLSVASLVADLRRVASDETNTEGMRRAAALRLARLATVTDSDGNQPFRAADPDTWWGTRAATGPAPEPGEVIDVTGSTLQSLLRCPRHWFLSRRAHAEAGRASRASVGVIVHSVAQRAALDGLTLEQARAELDAVWHRVPFEAEWLSTSERGDIDAALERFYRWSHANPCQVLGVEVPFSVELDVDGARVRLKGAVDRLELDHGRLKVVDVKTGRSAPRAADVDHHEQLGVYQLAAQLGAFDAVSGGVREVAPASLLYLRKGESEPLELFQKSLDDAPTLKDEEPAVGPTWVHDRLAVAVRTIRSGEFEARECSMCRYCPFADSCPALHPAAKQVGA